MRGLFVLIFALFGAAAAPAAELEASSALEAVTIHPDGATVTRVIRTALPEGDTALIARDFPVSLDPASLRIEGETARRVAIGSIEARPPKPVPPVVPPEIERKLEALRDDLDALNGKIGAATARKRFAERFAAEVPLGLGEKGDARPLAEWRTAFAAVAEDIAAADVALRELVQQRRPIEREISRLEAEMKATPPRKMEVRIDLSAEAATDAALRVTYTVRGARWVPLYDARLDTGGAGRKPSLELVRRAEIVQQTGEDWRDVVLAVSTVRTAKGGNAPELRPLIARFQEPPRPVAAAPAPLARAPVAKLEAGAAPRGLAQEAEAATDAGDFQAVFRVPGHVSVAANEGAKSFRLATRTIAPDLLVRTAPALDQTAFLEAGFKHDEEVPLLPGRVALYRDGMLVGRSELPLAGKEEPVRLGFGADDRTKVTRVVVRKTEGSAGMLTSSKTDEREFRISVRNGHDVPTKVVVEDQLPVSESAEIQVELLPVTTQPTQRDVRDRRGVLAWQLDLAPGEARDIRLAWRMRWPAEKTIVVEPQRP